MWMLGWIIIGLVAGFIASKIVNKEGQGFVLDLVLGIAGAIVGGLIFSWLGHGVESAFSWYSLFVAVVGSIIVLVVYHAIAGRRAS